MNHNFAILVCASFMLLSIYLWRFSGRVLKPISLLLGYSDVMLSFQRQLQCLYQARVLRNCSPRALTMWWGKPHCATVTTARQETNQSKSEVSGATGRNHLFPKMARRTWNEQSGNRDQRLRQPRAGWCCHLARISVCPTALSLVKWTWW